jgi:hypothetical protein
LKRDSSYFVDGGNSSKAGVTTNQRIYYLHFSVPSRAACPAFLICTSHAPGIFSVYTMSSQLYNTQVLAF